MKALEKKSTWFDQFLDIFAGSLCVRAQYNLYAILPLQNVNKNCLMKFNCFARDEPSLQFMNLPYSEPSLLSVLLFSLKEDEEVKGKHS